MCVCLVRLHVGAVVQCWQLVCYPLPNSVLRERLRVCACVREIVCVCLQTRVSEHTAVVVHGDGPHACTQGFCSVLQWCLLRLGFSVCIWVQVGEGKAAQDGC